jgi:hypothetical protein
MSKTVSQRLALASLLALSASCFGRQGGAPPPEKPPPLSAAAVTALIPPRVKDRSAWAQAVLDALAANDLEADASAVCSVLAIIGQESGFQEDPVVPGLARVVETRLASYQDRMGPLGKPIVRRLLSARSPDNPRSFEERLHTVRTERDLDLVFRDMLVYYQANHSILFDAVSLAGKLFDISTLAELNPITTAGPMQVSVQFSERWAHDHGADPTRVRDSLYTRQGGVYYGTARLFGYQASYDRMLFRFADYNAGVYTSRNAALQAQLSRLVGTPLARDGDLLSYGKDGQPKDEDTHSLQALFAFRDRRRPDLSDRRLRADVAQEKTFTFETTETYQAIKTAAATLGPPDYAILPDVTIDSPKLSRKRSTAWFAESVDRRYHTCLTSAGAP